MFVVEKNTPRRASVGMVNPTAMASGDLSGDVGIKSAKREPYVEGNLKICHTMDIDALTVGGRPESVEVLTLRYSPDGSVLAVGCIDSSIRLYSSDSSNCLYVLSDDDTKGSRLPVTSIRFKPIKDGTKKDAKHLLVATYTTGWVKFWHYSSGQCLHTIDEGRQTLSSAFNPDGTRLVTCGVDPQLNVYDVDSRKKLKSLKPSDSRDVMNGHRARVFTIQYHPTMPHTFVTGGWDDTVQFWDDRQEHSVKKLYGPHICGDALDIDPFQNHIVTGSWRKDNALQIWDFQSGAKVRDVPQDPMNGSLLYCAQWLGKENIVCGGSKQNMVRVIDRGTLNTVGQLVDLPNGVFCIDNDRQNKPRIGVATGSRVYVLKMEKRQ